MPGFTSLAERLRTLRLQGWGGGQLTQPQVAKAIGVSVPLISSWERDTVPPEHRLDAYARLFAGIRTVEGGKVRVAPADQFGEPETQRYKRLRAELLDLRGGLEPGAGSEPRNVSPLQFPPGEAITIVCSQLPRQRRAAFGDAHPTDPDFIESYKYADLDALLELLPEVISLNRNSAVMVGTAGELSQNDLTAHLIALGGVDWNEVTAETLRDLSEVPVRQLERPTQEVAGGFSVGTSAGRYELSPKLRRMSGRTILLEDVGQFLRAPNPFNHQRTLTFFNGMYNRGSYGMVRALTDPKIQQRNTSYLAGRFQQVRAFSIVCRVKIVASKVVSPDWTLPEIRLHEWPEFAV